MPELAEVEFFRKRWDHAARGERIVRIHTHDAKKLLRKLDLPAFRAALTGAKLLSSEARAKQMLFRFSGDGWLGIHLGMSGELSAQPAAYPPAKHDHLVLFTEKHALVFNDPRMFGSVDFHVGQEPPAWWSRIAPAILSKAFTVKTVAAFLARRKRAPIKAVLLMQERFPGVGNWMADEILWRAAIHPRQAAGTLSPAQVKALWRECRTVCRQALDKIAGPGNALPADLNVDIPKTWLFRHRWRAGGNDPKTGTPLAHATIGGRTTCWSPARQKLPKTKSAPKPRAKGKAPKA